MTKASLKNYQDILLELEDISEKPECKDRVDELIAEKQAIESFILEIAKTDYQTSKILKLRFIEKQTWKTIARVIGGKNTADSCRKRIERFFQKK